MPAHFPNPIGSRLEALQLFPGGYTYMDLSELNRLYDFSGKTVVITGGAGILGGEFACALVGCGANVAILDRNLDPVQHILELMEPRANQAVAISADVLNLDTLHKAAETIREKFGKVDCLLNSAGGNKPQATTGADLPFFDLPPDALRWVFDLNLMGTILPSQVFGKMMAEKGEGVILNISSMSALRPLTRVVAYSAAKAGVSNFTQWLAVHVAQEYSPRIRVNAIAPGFFLTQQNRFLLTEELTGNLTARGKAIISHTPMARFGQPEDLFGAVLWLLSPASAFVTGIVVPVDGGFSAFAGV
jgi:NAD(P)-dependent dehydrogenase (short-subunit alcohol dehydrogenase family)